MKCDNCYKEGIMVDVGDDCTEGFLNVCVNCCGECEHRNFCVVFGEEKKKEAVKNGNVC